MKLRNKKTGEIDEFLFEVIKDRIDLYRRVGHSETKNIWHYNSLAELNAEWEDYEEPKEYWYIDEYGSIDDTPYVKEDEVDQTRMAIGNFFTTKEEAERAIEKLKAWKRLKDKGFRFEGIKEDFTRILQQNPFRTGKRYLQFNKSEDEDWMKENWNDLDLLFGGEE